MMIFNNKPKEEVSGDDFLDEWNEDNKEVEITKADEDDEVEEELVDPHEKLNNLLFILLILVGAIILIGVAMIMLGKSKSEEIITECIEESEDKAATDKEMQGMLDNLGNIFDYLGKMKETVNSNQATLDSLSGDDANSESVNNLSDKMENLDTEIYNTKENITKLMQLLASEDTPSEKEVAQYCKVISSNLDNIDKDFAEAQKELKALLVSLKNGQDTTKEAISSDLDSKMQILDKEIVTTKSEITKLVTALTSSEKNANEDMDKYYKNIEKAIGDFEKTSDSANSDLKALLDALQSSTDKNQKDTIDKLSQEMSGLNKEIDSTTNNVKDLINTLTNKTDTSSTNLTAYYNDILAEFNQLCVDLDESVEKIGDMLNVLKENEDSIYESLSTDLNNGNERIENYLDESLTGIYAKLDELFTSVASGKRGMSSALATIGSDVPMDGDGEYEILSFQDLLDKTKHSQDIKENDVAAIADNISKDKSVWVEGNYITGNGKDVDDAYSNGYDNGYAEGFAASPKTSGGTIVYTLGHVHTGGTTSSTSRNGCYQSKYESYTYTSTQHSCQTSDGDNGGGIAGTTQFCNICGKTLSYYGGITGDPGSGCYPHQVTGYHWVGYLVCGMNAGDEVRQTSDLSTMTANEKINYATISFE